MPNWIDELKQQDLASEEARVLVGQMKLRQDRILAEKAPDFWRTFVAALKDGCAQLREAFPERPNRQCAVEENTGGLSVTIANQDSDASIRLCVSFTSHQIREWHMVLDPDTMRVKVTDNYYRSFGLDQNDYLVVSFGGGKSIRSPHEMAERYLGILARK